MRALTIRQPWCWAILHAKKRIENRTWKTAFRGPVFVHAAAGLGKAECHDAMDFICDINPGICEQWPGREHCDRGGIVGIATITDCVSESSSPWFFGPYGFVLKNVHPVPFIECKGALSFWRVPSDVLVRVEAKGEGAE